MHKLLLAVIMVYLPLASAQEHLNKRNFCSKTAETRVNPASPEITDAAKRGDAKKIAAELRRGLDANSTTNEGFSLLDAAITEHKNDVLDLLVKAGADVNKPFIGVSPLMMARVSNNAYAEKLLVGKGAKLTDSDNAINEMRKFGLNLGDGIIDAIKKGDMNRLSVYVGTMADIDDPLIKTGKLAGFTSMHVAAAENSVDAIKYLAGCGANLNARVTASGAPVMWFAKSPEARDLLKSLGAVDENAPK